MSFKSSSGIYFSRALFREEFYKTPEDRRSKECQPIYTLHDDVPGFINFGQKYVELRDPTGYKVAKELLAGYRHWQTLLKCTWFQEAKAVWDDELEALLASEAIEKLRELSDSGNLQAAKFLATKEYKAKKGRGRPSKEEVEAELKTQARADKNLDDDLARINEAGKVVTLHAKKV